MKKQVIVRKRAALCDLPINIIFLNLIRGVIMANRRIVIDVMVLFATSLILTGCGNSSVAEFHQAVQSGDLETAEALLTEEPTLVDTEAGGQALLFEALREEQRDMVLLLIDSGVDVNVKEQCFSPLHCAAQQGHAEIAELLIAKGANPNATDMMGETPLHEAVLGGHKDVVVVLLAGGADVDAENRMRRTPLHFAARDGYLDVVEILLAQGADVNAKDKSPSRTPLHYAAQEDHKEVAELLLTQGADVNARDLLSRTPLYWASIRANKDGVCKEVVELLRKNGGQY
jgi:ankyrin repeat protein